MIKGVLFDLDGTLVDSINDLAGCANYVLLRNGFPAHSLDEFRYFVGYGIPKMIENALPPEARSNRKLNERCVKQFLERYEKHYCDTTKPYPGIPELLEELQKRDIKIGIASNKNQEMVEKVVKSCFGDTFKVVIGRREGYPAKPNPTLPNLAAKKLKVKPEDCFYLGDSAVDMVAAIAGGMTPVGVLWGFRTFGELRLNGARRFISKPAELFDVIENEDKFDEDDE